MALEVQTTSHVKESPERMASVQASPSSGQVLMQSVSHVSPASTRPLPQTGVVIEPLEVASPPVPPAPPAPPALRGSCLVASAHAGARPRARVRARAASDIFLSMIGVF